MNGLMLVFAACNNFNLFNQLLLIMNTFLSLLIQYPSRVWRKSHKLVK